MPTVTQALLWLLGLLALTFSAWWYRSLRGALPRSEGPSRRPGVFDSVLGFVTNFFDTLGIGSFAPTTAALKLQARVPDEDIPGTLNVGHTLPTILQAVIFIGAVAVGPLTLVLMIVAAVVGAWLGAGIVSRLPRRAIQVGMGTALAIAALIFILMNFSLLPGGGTALSLSGPQLLFAVGCNFVLGALMTLGIGLYAPCLILVSLLGMNPIAAFPIMMGSCAFLMPTAGVRFVRSGRYSIRTALGLALGGIPGVLIAAYLVRSLPLAWLRWLVVVVVVYAAAAMLRSAFTSTAKGPVVGSQ